MLTLTHLMRPKSYQHTSSIFFNQALSDLFLKKKITNFNAFHIRYTEITMYTPQKSLLPLLQLKLLIAVTIASHRSICYIYYLISSSQAHEGSTYYPHFIGEQIGEV